MRRKSKVCKKNLQTCPLLIVYFSYLQVDHSAVYQKLLRYSWSLSIRLFKSVANFLLPTVNTRRLSEWSMARYRFVCEVIRFIINISLMSYISGFLSHYGRCHHSYHGSIQFIFVNQYYYIPIRSLLRSIIIVNGVIKWEWGGGQGLGLGLANSYNNTFDTNFRYNLGPFFLCLLCFLWSIFNSLRKL